MRFMARVQMVVLFSPSMTDFAIKERADFR
jgi:hypothetical protein